MLIRDEDNERVRAEFKTGSVGPERTGAGFDEVDEEVVGAGQINRLAVEAQTLVQIARSLLRGS